VNEPTTPREERPAEGAGHRPAERTPNVDELYRLLGSRVLRSLIEAELSGHHRHAAERRPSADVPRALGAMYVGTFVAGLRLWGCMIDAWASAIPSVVDTFVSLGEPRSRRGAPSDLFESLLARFAAQPDWGSSRAEAALADLLLFAMDDPGSWQRRYRAKA
jgi:hypothetical protein